MRLSGKLFQSAKTKLWYLECNGDMYLIPTEDTANFTNDTKGLIASGETVPTRNSELVGRFKGLVKQGTLTITI